MKPRVIYITQGEFREFVTQATNSLQEAIHATHCPDTRNRAVAQLKKLTK